MKTTKRKHTLVKKVKRKYTRRNQVAATEAPRVKRKYVRRKEPVRYGAALLLRAESVRLEMLAAGHKEAAAKRSFEAMAWAYKVSAAWLDSLPAPERLVRYTPCDKAEL